MSDFYLQPESMALEKNKSGKVMIEHGLVYLFTMAILVFLFFDLSWIGWLLILSIPVLHMGIDLAKGWWLNKKSFFQNHETALFIADQALHIIIIILVAWFYATCAIVAYSKLGTTIGSFYDSLQLGLSGQNFIRLICLFLFLGKPVNLIIRHLLKHDENEEAADLNATQKAGRVIGILERYLTVILILLQQYAAVGLAFTAKSVIRFDKIHKQSDFAEKYLIGTMGSLLFAIVAAVLYLFVPV